MNQEQERIYNEQIWKVRKYKYSDLSGNIVFMNNILSSYHKINNLFTIHKFVYVKQDIPLFNLDHLLNLELNCHNGINFFYHF